MRAIVVCASENWERRGSSPTRGFLQWQGTFHAGSLPPLIRQRALQLPRRVALCNFTAYYRSVGVAYVSRVH